MRRPVRNLANAETDGTETPTVTSEVEIRQITLDELLLNGSKLFEQHCQELEGKPLELDSKRYSFLESKGMLLVLAAYCDDQIVGYSTNVFYRHGHHNTFMSVNDSLYVIPNFGRGAGMLLIRQTEKHAKKHGADCMLWMAKVGSVLDLILSSRRVCKLTTHNYTVNFNDHG